MSDLEIAAGANSRSGSRKRGMSRTAGNSNLSSTWDSIGAHPGGLAAGDAQPVFNLSLLKITLGAIHTPATADESPCEANAKRNPGLTDDRDN
jgi:hypothetical protein